MPDKDIRSCSHRDMKAINFPKISIVTPSLNQGRFLEQTTCSVLDQGYPNLEYIIIDGGSTDNSVEIIKKYEKHLTYWVSEEDRGQSHAINKGFERASGDMLGWLNSDDYYASCALKVVAEAFMSNTSAGAIVGAGEMVDEFGRFIRHCEAFDITVESLYGWIYKYFYQPSCFFSRAAWQECGPLNEWLHYAMDLDLWLRIAKKFSFASLDSTLSTSIKHDQAKTTAKAYLTVMEVALVIASHGGMKTVRDDYAGFLSVNEQCRQQIELMTNSASWNITAPLRRLSAIFRKLRSKVAAANECQDYKGSGSHNE